MKYTLEGLKVFPYIAWAVVLGFAFFTYTLAGQLNEDLDVIAHTSDTLHATVAE